MLNNNDLFANEKNEIKLLLDNPNMVNDKPIEVMRLYIKYLCNNYENKEDIEKEELFLGEINGAIACAFVINEEYDEEYNDANWEYKNSKFKVIHRLCVNVGFQNMGIGKRVMKIIEEELRKENVECIRLDTFSKNPFSIKLYENIGFKKVGEANWRKGLFNIYEKNILKVYN